MSYRQGYREQQEMKLEKLCQELWRAWDFYLFHANESACQSFMDVCRTYKTSGSGAMRFLILEIQYKWPNPVIGARAYICTYTHKTYIYTGLCKTWARLF